MSQYFRPRRATFSSATLGSHIPVPSSSNGWHRNRSDIDLDNNQIASSSILIFPNPPEEQELRSAVGSGFELSASTLSLPSDVTLESARSTSRSRSRGHGERVQNRNERWQNVLPTLPRDRGWDELLLEEESEWELGSSHSRPENARFTNHPPRGRHIRTSSSLSSLFTFPFSLSPQPPFRLPFLSFLRSFLTLDESTLHLISRSPDPHVSSLFPVSPGPHSHSYSDDDEEPRHGALKLLLHNPDKSQNTALLKAGIDPSEVPGDANPSLMHPARIPVWRLLELVIEGGVRVWKEVRTWDAGDIRLMGV